VATCTVCGNDAASTYRSGVTSVYSRKKYNVAQCGQCGHFFTDPAPEAAELDDIYTNKYSYDAHRLIDAEKQMRARNYADYIAGLEGAKSALEVGCMHGLLLKELKRNGMEVAGVELNPDAVRYCRDQGLNVVQSSIEDHLEQAGNQHDVIIMSHVIEHIADPRKQLDALRQRMADGGRLVLITPNSLAPTRRLFGRYWGYWQVPVHINHFNAGSMRELLKRAGFEVVETRFYGGDSLFFLSSLANLLGAGNDTKQLSGPKRALVSAASAVLKPWYFAGKEDMLVVARKATRK
jgi:2-polyprenyl-3-methyl-5-hydroxy-6-metoxy-1,4-benzoquinol methylase